MTDIDIRYLTEKDISQVVEIEKISFSTPWSAKSFENEINSNQTIYIAAFDKERVVGYMGMWKIVDEGHVTNIAVHPDYRGQGIAGRILSRMIEEAEKNNIFSMTLEVRKTNETAKNLYKKFGFKEVAVRKKYYSDNNEDAIIMWRE